MDDLHKSTKAIQAGKATHQEVRPVAMPIYLSSTYERKADGSYHNNYVYSRNDNPNRQLLEQSMAELEGGAVAYAFSSGMAAISAVLQSLTTGDHILLADDVYFKVRTLLDDVYNRWGLSYSLVDMTDLDAVAAAIGPHTRMLWLESPSNPMLKITDIEAVTTLTREYNCLTVVDNTWATPILMNPIQLGADIVVHSTTKYIGGHSDVLGGAVVCGVADDTAQRVADIQVAMGAVPSPFDCWLVSRGVQTLPLRVAAQSSAAMKLAQYLAGHDQVEVVHYPGLTTHAGHSIAASQMSDYGAMLSVQIVGGQSAALAVCNALQLFTQATSLGGVESLVEHRQSVEGPSSSTPPSLLRLSVGLEHAEDLISDFAQALQSLA